MIEYTAKIIIPLGDEGKIINVDLSNLISIKFSQTDRSDLNLPSWGIISNNGEIKFIDKTGEIASLAEQGFLKKGATVRFYINDKQVEQYITSDWNYSTETKEVLVTVKDNLEEWQDISVSEIKYDFETPTAVTFAYVYEKLKIKTPIKYNVLLFDKLDDETQTYLSSIYLKHWFLKSKTLWQMWNEFAIATKCHIFKNNGVTECKYNGGN